MIVLDGNTFKVFQTQYTHSQSKIADVQRGITGQPLRVESGAFKNEYKLSLLCTTAQITLLRASFAKTATTGTPPTNQLTFIDEENVKFDPASGSDDATHRYGTGVYFLTMDAPKPMTSKGWRPDNLFLVAVTLEVKDNAL